MAGRYEKIKEIGHDLWVESCPVILYKGALLTDTKQQKNLLQLGFESLITDEIVGIQVVYQGYSIGKELLEEGTHSFLDLKLKYNQKTGADEAIYLENIDSREFKIKVSVVYFSDGTQWSSDKYFVEIAKEKTLHEKLGKYYDQFLRSCNLKSNVQLLYVPQFVQKYWICACGTVNQNVGSCRCCGMSFNSLKQCLNTDYLQKEEEKYLDYLRREEEIKQKKAIREAEELRRLQEQKKEKELAKKKKIRRIIMGGGCLAILYFIILFGSKIVVPNLRYSTAEKALKEKKYDIAIEKFSELGNYKLSKKMVIEAKYLKANDLLAKKEYRKAVVIFEDLSDYKNSQDNWETCHNANIFEDAISLATSKKYKEALDKLSLLPSSFDGCSDKKAEFAYALVQEYYKTNKLKEAYETYHFYNLNQDIYNEICYAWAKEYADSTKYDKAIELLGEIKDYKDSKKLIKKYNQITTYNSAVKLMEDGELSKAIRYFSKLPSSYKKTKKYRSLCEKYNHYNGIWKCYAYTIYHDDGEVSNLNYTASDEKIECKVEINRKGKETFCIDGKATKRTGNILTWCTYYKGADVTKMNLSTGVRKVQFMNSKNVKSDLYVYKHRVK